ncbi:MAG: hypothetical protein WDO68_07545 [Gammaproteobacteria bacterium]
MLLRWNTILGSLALMLAACAMSAQTAVVALPNGYYLQPDSKRETQLVKRGGKVVMRGPIAAYAVSATIVAGAEGAPSAESRSYTNDLPFEGKAETRYFVLDTNSGKLDSNLDAASWEQRLKALGVATPLRIYAPLKWP